MEALFSSAHYFGVIIKVNAKAVQQQPVMLNYLLSLLSLYANNAGGHDKLASLHSDALLYALFFPLSWLLVWSLARNEALWHTKEEEERIVQILHCVYAHSINVCDFSIVKAKSSESLIWFDGRTYWFLNKMKSALYISHCILSFDEDRDCEVQLISNPGPPANLNSRVCSECDWLMQWEMRFPTPRECNNFFLPHMIWWPLFCVCVRNAIFASLSHRESHIFDLRPFS